MIHILNIPEEELKEQIYKANHIGRIGWKIRNVQIKTNTDTTSRNAYDFIFEIEEALWKNN